VVKSASGITSIGCGSRTGTARSQDARRGFPKTFETSRWPSASIDETQPLALIKLQHLLRVALAIATEALLQPIERRLQPLEAGAAILGPARNRPCDREKGGPHDERQQNDCEPHPQAQVHGTKCERVLDGRKPVLPKLHVPFLRDRRVAIEQRIRQAQTRNEQDCGAEELGKITMHEILDDAAGRACRYLSTLNGRPVAPSAGALGALSELDEPLPQHPGNPAETLALLDRVVSPATMGMAGRRFFGFVIGGSLPVALAANWLAGSWDQNAGLYEVTPGVARIEEVTSRWLIDLFELPASTATGFVTGATVANFTALAAARHAVLASAGWNVEAEGLFGAPPITVITGAEAHPTLLKSLGMLGLGRSRVVRVPVDAQGRMRADALPTLKGPTILCLQAGNVNTGAFDPFEPLIETAHASGAWVHVDGAFGLWAKAAPSLRHLAQGLERADSWATDAHKWLNVPYDSGLAFSRDAQALRAAMAITAEYLPSESPHRNPSDFTPELSRRARGVEVWAAMRSLGKAGLAELFERNCRQAQRFANALRAAGHTILNDVLLNQVLVAFGDAARTRDVIAVLQKEGTCWCGPTVWQGRTAMRISVSSWATTDADVELSLDAMLRAATSQA
jgi:glutamate/tyrosine decarboxylase-like PLP-dependent enzyme